MMKPGVNLKATGSQLSEIEMIHTVEVLLRRLVHAQALQAPWSIACEPGVATSTAAVAFWS